MTDTFDDLKIASELVAGAESMGWEAPAGLQRDAMAVIRRGNNVVLHGSPGSGAVGAYGLGILDRLLQVPSESDDVRALVLVPDAHTASATADSLARLAGLADITVRALGPGWAAGPARLLVAPVSTALDAVRTSTLKLDGVEALVIDGVGLLADSDQWRALETLVDAVPGAAQRIVVTGRFDDTIDSFLEGHVRKAMTVPPRTEPKEPADTPTIRYAVVPEAGKAEAAVELLDGMTGAQVAVVCRTVDRAEEARHALDARGVLVRPDTTLLVLPRREADQRSVQAAVLSYDVPFDADELEALHGGGGAILVTPRERAHLLRIAGRVGLRLQAVAVGATRRTDVAELRDRLRDIARDDLTPELALLEPLLEELPAVELAAAALRLGRASRPAATPAATPAAAPTAPRSSAPPPQAGTWVHLFMSVGSRDDVGPGDIVGAMTGEAGISGDQVGKIDIRESHSTVEVATEVAPRVIEALNGRSLKGRSVRVDYDRKDRDRQERGRGAPGKGRAAPGKGRGGPGGGGRGPGRTGRRPRG